MGRFWWADAAAETAAFPVKVKHLTWENIFAGRDRTGQYNAQIEFHDDGNFITRSNNVERVYRRVLPYDLDNDGLPNDIDPAPEVPLVPSAWNQSEEWAAAAFPSNAAEISAMGGYAAWAAARGTDPDRRLVSLGVVFDDGSAWPTLLDFGGVPVAADGAAELVFAIDCGAKVPFSLTSGRLGSLAVTVTEPSTRLGEGMTTTESSEFQSNYGYPHERTVNDVKVHLDGPRSGWLCRTAGVSVEPSWLPHFSPNDSVELTATVSDCHSNAYLGCTWTGGAGITFSQEHSLSTTVTYDPDEPDIWATNGIDLITQFVGYTLTNHINVTVGVQVEPPLGFSLGCQEIFFLNDAELGSTSNRAERIRPVTLNLTGPLGTNGTARLSVLGDVAPVLFYVTGTITATFTPADGGEPLTDSVTFRCIEPLRKLVTTEQVGGRYVNPSRLVMGTNAVLKVGANGPFSPSEVNWHVVSGSAQLVSDGWYATVTPTGTETVTVEARFNGDEIQPCFVLPVTQPRTIPLKALVATYPHGAPVTSLSSIQEQIRNANTIFSQVGVTFELQGQPEYIQGTNALDLTMYEIHEMHFGDDDLSYEEYTSAFMDIVKPNRPVDCLEIYYVGRFKYANIAKAPQIAMCLSQKIVMPMDMGKQILAHELGHSFGLQDIYVDTRYGVKGANTNWVELASKDQPLDLKSFSETSCDWGDEMGRGFYEKEDTLSMAIRSLLMFGVDDGSEILGDIPDEQVLGLPDGAQYTENARLIWVGAKKIDE